MPLKLMLKGTKGALNRSADRQRRRKKARLVLNKTEVQKPQITLDKVISTLRKISKNKEMKKMMQREIEQMDQVSKRFNEKRRKIGQQIAQMRVVTGAATKKTDYEDNVNQLCAQTAVYLNDSAAASHVRSLLIPQWTENSKGFYVDTHINTRNKTLRLRDLTHRRHISTD